MKQFIPPSGWDLRSNQVSVIAEIEKAFRSGKKLVAVQGPTGSGKSVIGMTAALAFDSSYYVVPLKSLQDQVASDFGNHISILKGKSNYLCTQFTKNYYTVDKAPCQERGQEEIKKECKQHKLCNYYNALEAAANHPLTLMNFHLFLCWMRLRSIMMEPPFHKRRLHVIDEAHKIEETIRDFLTISLSEHHMNKFMSIEFPRHIRTQKEIIFFLTEVNEKNLEIIQRICREEGVESKEDLIVKKGDEEDDKTAFHLDLDQKLENFFKDPETYAFGYEERWHGIAKRVVPYITIKPTKVGGFIREQVLGDYTLLLSATLTKKSVLAMGFSEEEIHYIDMDSIFPAENRPIRFKIIGKINKENSDSLIPKMVEEVENILEEYPNVKGMIHAPSYRVAELLERGLRKSEHHKRILLQPREKGGAAKILDRHEGSDEPTVLLSPGMKEGIDLKDDLSRFQIILKCPFPSLGDPATAKLAKADYMWYINRTIVDFMQMYGRSIRTPEDFADTIIMDENLRSILRNNSRMIPTYIKEAIIWPQ